MSGLVSGIIKPCAIYSVAQMVQIIQENEGFQHGCNEDIMEILNKYELDTITWCNEFAIMLQSRSMTIENDKKQEKSKQ